MAQFNMERLNDTFNWPVYYREVGYYVKQREEYERSLKFFDQSLKKEPENIRTLHGRAIARAKAMKFTGAIEDIKKILTLEPENIYLKAERALITYLGCEFEDALIQNFRSVPLRQKPDNFVMGVMHCEDAILNCLSERAGKPLRDHFKIIRKIAWMRTLEKQRPYKPVAQQAKKKKKAARLALPTSQVKKKKEKVKTEEPNKMHHHHRGSTGSFGKLLTASIAMISEGSSIRDSLASHESSLQNLKIPPGPAFPHRPMQRHTTNIDNYLAERYLNKLYHDKLFLKNLPSAVGSAIANEKGSKKIKELAQQGFRNVYHAQEILRARRPFYFIKYQEARTCGKLDIRRNETLKTLQDMALKQANKILSKAKYALENRQLRELLEAVEKMITFCENTPKKVFPTRAEYVKVIECLACEGFYLTKKFSKHMTHQQKNDRVQIILGLPTDRFPSSDSLANDMRGWYVDWRKMADIYEKRLYKASGPEEFSFLYHELARFTFEAKKYELSRLYARKCVTEANLCKNLKWILNAMLLIARIDIVQKNKNDAKSQVRHAKKVANRIRDDDMVEMLEMCVNAIEQSSLDDALGIKILEMREKQIIKLLDSQTMKDEAAYLFRRISTLPVPKRMSVMPGFTYVDRKIERSSSSSRSDISAVVKMSKVSTVKRSDTRGVAFLDLIQ